MRVAFFGQSGPYAPLALRYLLQNPGEFELVVVVVGTRPSPGKADHRWYAPKPAPLPEGEDLISLATSAGIVCLRTCDVNDSGVVAGLAKQRIDLAVCVGFDRLFSHPLLHVAGRGFINAHPSPLPLLRGPSPIFWALKQGRRDLAVTLHGMDERADHGPIFAQTGFALTPLASGEAIFQAAGSLAGRLLRTLLNRAAHEALTGTVQDDSRATRAPRPKPEDAQVDPRAWRCQDLVNFASVAPFFRAAWLRFHDEPFFLRRGLRVEQGRRLPAEYVIEGSTLIVQCLDGLAYLEMQV